VLRENELYDMKMNSDQDSSMNNYERQLSGIASKAHLDNPPSVIHNRIKSGIINARGSSNSFGIARPKTGGSRGDYASSSSINRSHNKTTQFNVQSQNYI
jgi:hypothetical protein